VLLASGTGFAPIKALIERMEARASAAPPCCTGAAAARPTCT
jgi:NAD(P)H-flavin reductase